MKNECSIVRDLLALYVEDMVSPDTAEFVGAHLKTCTECQKEHAQLKLPQTIATKPDIAPLKKLKRKMRAKKIQIVAFTALLVIALLVSAFAFVSAPKYLPYSENLITITENEDKSITLTFDEQVTDYHCYAIPDPEPFDESETTESRHCHYSVVAWTSLWDRWFSNRGVQSCIIQPDENSSLTVHYTQNNGSVDILIYGEEPTDYAGVVTLPRLVLAYYLLLAFFAFGNLLGLWFIVRFALKRKVTLRLWVERLALYPLSYILAHFSVKGFQTDSYAITRDFLLIVFISVIIYCSALLIHSVLHLRKEIREMNK